VGLVQRGALIHGVLLFSHWSVFGDRQGSSGHIGRRSPHPGATNLLDGTGRDRHHHAPCTSVVSTALRKILDHLIRVKTLVADSGCPGAARRLFAGECRRSSRPPLAPGGSPASWQAAHRLSSSFFMQLGALPWGAAAPPGGGHVQMRNRRLTFVDVFLAFRHRGKRRW